MAIPARTKPQSFDLPLPARRILTERHAIERARRWSWALAEYCLQDEQGRFVKEARFHKDWHAQWNEGQTVTIGPRGHGKTENLIAKVIHRLGTNPDKRIKYISAEPDLATSVVGAVGEHIEKNERLHQVFPELRPDKANSWSKHTLFVRRHIISKDASLQAWGVTQGTSGGRCTDLIGDDVCNWRNSIGQPALRAKVKTAWRDNWMKFLIPGGIVNYVATPWSTGDLTAEQVASTLWKTWKRPAMDRATGEVLWPERFTKQYFEELLADPYEGPSARRQYMLEAISDADTMFGHEAIDLMFDYSLMQAPEMNIVGWAGGVDLAVSEKETANWTVMATAAVMADGTRILADIWRARVAPVPSWDRMINSWRRYHHNLLLVENNAYQQSAVDYIKRAEPKVADAVQGFTTGRQKADEKVGLPGLAGRLALWKVPMGDARHEEEICRCDRCQLRAELKSYPYGEYSDCLMALWFCDTAAERVLRMAPGKARGAVGDSRRPVGADRIWR